MIQNLVPVLRELGLVTIFWDVNFTSVHSRFDEDGTLLDETFLPRIEKFLDELLWMARRFATVASTSRSGVPREPTAARGAAPRRTTRPTSSSIRRAREEAA